MKYTFITVSSLLLASGLGLARIYAQEGVRAAGGLATGAGGTASYSVGQLAYLTGNGPGGTFSPGVQHPFEIIVLSTALNVDVDLTSSVYPNPTAKSLTLQIKGRLIYGMTWRLTDLSGRRLLYQRINSESTQILLADLAVGAYLLTVSNTKQDIKTFKIIKY